MEGTRWGEIIGIRPLLPTDAPTIRRYMTDPEVVHLLFEEDEGEPPGVFALALMIALNRMHGRLEFGIVERSGRLIGSVKLWRVSERNRTCMLTIFIGEKSRWGQGRGTDALRLILSLAFEELEMERVELHVFDFNPRAIRSYEKVGFVREGSRRNALVRADGYHNILVMGILRSEFYAREAERLRQSLSQTQ